MKIELKNIRFSEALSEETNAFTADLYVNGKKAGYCKNTGQGGCTDYYGIEKHSSDIIKEAEAYCKAQPDIDFGTFTIKNNLEHTIDQLFEDWLKAKETKKFEKQMKTAILLGVPNGMSYTRYSWKGKSLSEIPKGALQISVNELKKKCTGGVVILNTNLEALGINV
jgi:hypothetical protein